MAKAFANAGYNYRTSVVKDHEDKSLVNGGVLIGSKWPILREVHCDPSILSIGDPAAPAPARMASPYPLPGPNRVQGCLLWIGLPRGQGGQVCQGAAPL